MKVIRLFFSINLILGLSALCYGQKARPANFYYVPSVRMDGVPRVQLNTISTKIEQAVTLLNKPPGGALSAEQRTLLQYTSQIVIQNEAINVSYYDYQNNTIRLSMNDILSGSPAWIATAILHEDTHAKLYKEGRFCLMWGKYAEVECYQSQIDAARNVGLEPGALTYLTKIVGNPTHHKQYVKDYEVVVEERYTMEDNTIFYPYDIPELYFRKGDRAYVCSDGEISFGPRAGPGDPDGLYKTRTDKSAFSYYSLDSSYPHGSLLYRINSTGHKLGLWSDWKFIGKNWDKNLFRVEKDGWLEMAINDENWENNNGKYVIQVIVYRPKQRFADTQEPVIYVASPPSKFKE